jgi:hypothetical protein
MQWRDPNGCRRRRWTDAPCGAPPARGRAQRCPGRRYGHCDRERGWLARHRASRAGVRWRKGPPPRPAAMTFVTTEHFVLQGAHVDDRRVDRAGDDVPRFGRSFRPRRTSSIRASPSPSGRNTPACTASINVSVRLRNRAAIAASTSLRCTCATRSPCSPTNHTGSTPPISRCPVSKHHGTPARRRAAEVNALGVVAAVGATAARSTRGPGESWSPLRSSPRAPSRGREARSPVRGA